jgi:AmmeMemoRadiSam system protein B
MKIFEYIQNLDQEGMKHISMQEPGAFAKYLKETRNTICGRHAIQTWLNGIHCNNPSCEVLSIEFVKYAQSCQALSSRDSSVSYASATARERE